MAAFVNYDIFIVILDQAMSHLVWYFLLSRRMLSEKCTKQYKSYRISRAFTIFYTFRNFVKKVISLS